MLKHGIFSLKRSTTLFNQKSKHSYKPRILNYTFKYSSIKTLRRLIGQIRIDLSLSINQVYYMQFGVYFRNVQK